MQPSIMSHLLNLSGWYNKRINAVRDLGPSASNLSATLVNFSVVLALHDRERNRESTMTQVSKNYDTCFLGILERSYNQNLE